MSSPQTRNKPGIASYITVLVVLGGGFGLIAAFSLLLLNELKAGRAVIFSTKALYAAESGLEDALLRLQPERVSPPAVYTLVVDDAQATVSVGALVGGGRTLISDGSRGSHVRRIRSVTGMARTTVNFYYGAQVDEGGLLLGDNSKIIGNIFSNGNVVGVDTTKSEVTGTAKVSGSHRIEKIKVGGNAYADSFLNCEVAGTLYYVSSRTSCPAGAVASIATPPGAIALPIPPGQIEQWKSDAERGGTVAGYALDNNTSGTLGPKKVEGDITLGNSATLTLNGTVWVTGTINFGNSDILKLDSQYGPISGMIIVDGSVNWGNNLITLGSGQTGSYLLFISLAGGTAISVGNNATSSILFAPHGYISIGNNLKLREATAYGLNVGNNASIEYETGLSDADFTSGPSSGMKVVSWQEVP